MRIPPTESIAATRIPSPASSAARRCLEVAIDQLHAIGQFESLAESETALEGLAVASDEAGYAVGLNTTIDYVDTRCA